jgi:thiol-disulfide isomerase/thioredoxin
MRGLLVNLALLFAALLVATSPAVAADPASGARVDASTFDAIVAASDAAFVVKVHSPRCGTCQEMRPTWDALVAARSNDVKFATVDIDDDRGMKLAVELGVLDDGVPAVWGFDRAAEGERSTPRKLWSGYDAPSARELAAAIFEGGGVDLNGVRTADGFVAKA